MPIIKSAKKKLRADKKRKILNERLERILNSSIKKAEKLTSQKNIQEAISIIDKSAKKGIIHKNKASRLKSRLSKLLTKKGVRTQERQKNVTAKTKKTKI
ncbi:MAG: 30S ribosomal protein S20 [Candidatus Levybacteria bacterium]|nr:30S ribosomal protein S20 [Candidatus Levybacteria bacterium]